MQLTKEDLRRLNQAHPNLQLFIKEAAKDTPVPFKILEVARSIEAQRANVAKGVSKTLRSRHLPSKDGKTRALDAAPLINGKATWAWPPYFKLAAHLRKIAIKLDLPIEWGAVWDRDVRKLSADMELEVANYVKRQRAKGKKAFIDGPHWQLSWAAYP